MLRVKNFQHLCLIFLLIYDNCASAENLNLSDQIKKQFEGMATGLVYSYVSFDFNSEVFNSYNKFAGDSNIYAVYTSDIKLSEKVTTGLTFFNVKTQINSQVKIIDNPWVNSIQSINNNSIYGHILNRVTDHLFFNFSASAGQNTIKTDAKYQNGLTGYSNTSSLNWFTHVIGQYSNSWNSLTYLINSAVLYSQVNSPRYDFIFNNTQNNPISVAPLVTRQLFVFEFVELGYKTLKNNLTFTPFINGGLIQIPVYSTSRRTRPMVNGALPQLVINKNGYKAAVGVSLQHQKFRIRLEESIYQAGTEFTSYATIANVAFYLD
jgi:hypothetical protein